MLKLSLALLFLITSCSALTDNMLGAGNFSDADHFFGRFPANKKAVVIVKYSAPSHRDPLYLCSVANVDEEIHDVQGCLEVKGSDVYKMMVVEPGMYKTAKYSARKDDYIFGSYKKLLSGKKSLVFKVTSKEVMYVGDVRKRGRGFGVSDEFDVMKRAFDSKNYQELSGLFSNGFEEIEQIVDGYHVLSKPMVKELALAVDETKKEKKDVVVGKQSCAKKCSKTRLRKIRARERRIKMDQDKYSKQYLEELKDDLKFDKVRCGLL